MDAPHDVDVDGRWLTYGELAAIRGTTRASAERLARRMKWRRQSGNDGFARVLVPAAFLERAGERAKDNPRDDQGDAPPASEAFGKAIALLGEQLARERARGDKAESALAELRVTLERAQAAAREAQEAADTLRQADAARRARRFLTRLWAAVRAE